jgi:nucleoside-diphosphate-sugar epimerase
MSQLQGKTVLVTGATGFIGGRLVERLILDEGAQVRALVRRPSEVRWLCQFPVQMIHGDVSDANALANAAEGCEVIFHCAATMTGGDAAEYQRGTVAGTHNVARAALKAGARRLVYLSTVAVYNGVAGDIVDEQSPMPPTGQLYADSKIEAEAILAKYMREEGLPAVVLRPTMVYGPRCRWFTIEPVKKIRAGYLALVAGSQGICDVSYVDNLVDAMFLAEQHPDAVGQDFIISDGQPVLWRDFLNEYATMLGKAPLPTWSANMLRLARVLQSIRFVRRLVRKWPRMSPDDIQQQLPATRYNISKARRVLGYVPRVSLPQGMATTRAWLEDQGFIG